MDTFDHPAPDTSPTTSASADDVRTQVDQLRQSLQTMLVLLIVVSGTLTIFLMRQVKYVRSELTGFSLQTSNLVYQYEKTLAPNTDELARKLAAYGDRHPDFAPLMTKYNMKAAASNAAPAAAKAAPAPAPAPAQPAPTQKK